MAQMLGYAPEEALGRNMHAADPPRAA